MAAADLLERDLASQAFRQGVDQHFWRLADREGLTLHLYVYAPDDREYLLRLECSDYGAEPIEGLFVDDEKRACVEAAWPQGDGPFSQWVKFTGSELFICWDQDRRGVHHHGNWRPQKRWTQSQNQLVAYLNFVSRLLHVPANGYRRKSRAA